MTCYTTLNILTRHIGCKSWHRAVFKFLQQAAETYPLQDSHRHTASSLPTSWKNPQEKGEEKKKERTHWESTTFRHSRAFCCTDTSTGLRHTWANAAVCEMSFSSRIKLFFRLGNAAINRELTGRNISRLTQNFVPKIKYWSIKLHLQIPGLQSS